MMLRQEFLWWSISPWYSLSRSKSPNSFDAGLVKTTPAQPGGIKGNRNQGPGVVKQERMFEFWEEKLNDSLMKVGNILVFISGNNPFDNPPVDKNNWLAHQFGGDDYNGDESRHRQPDGDTPDYTDQRGWRLKTTGTNTGTVLTAAGAFLGEKPRKPIHNFYHKSV
jgi:hypothetical protein